MEFFTQNHIFFIFKFSMLFLTYIQMMLKAMANIDISIRESIKPVLLLTNVIDVFF